MMPHIYQTKNIHDNVACCCDMIHLMPPKDYVSTKNPHLIPGITKLDAHININSDNQTAYHFSYTNGSTTNVSTL